jgi:hypothetical protein
MIVPDDHELDRLRKFYIDIQSGLFSQSASYLNVVLAAGYVGAFTLWNLIRAQLTPVISNWVALLLSISLALYVGWTVFNMIWLALRRREYPVKLRGYKGIEFATRYEALEIEGQRTLFWYIPVWAVVISLAIATAFFALVLLMYNCAKNLLFQ